MKGEDVKKYFWYRWVNANELERQKQVISLVKEVFGCLISNENYLYTIGTYFNSYLCDLEAFLKKEVK